MSALVGELKEIILRALPSNDKNTTQLLIDRLVDSGLESKDDLQFVQQQDISTMVAHACRNSVCYLLWKETFTTSKTTNALRISFMIGRVVGEGYSSLLAQIKTRIENLSRTTSFRQHRSSGSGVKRGPTDTYGCTRFQPDLPLEETDVSIETKRQKLEHLYCREGAKGAEKAEVEKMMETTFCLQ
ncbi:unnamed protein product [Leuciscus chuanchicus]